MMELVMVLRNEQLQELIRQQFWHHPSLKVFILSCVLME
jgi:hypothetical protein